MLRINLLPPYIYEGAKRRNVTILWAVVLAAVVGGFIYWKVQLDAEANRLIAERQQQEPIMQEAQRTQQKANELETQNAAIKAKWQFVKSANEFVSTAYPSVFDNVRNYTLRGVLYDSVVPAGQTVSISAYAPSLATVGHYMMAMERNPNISNVSIAMNSIPGFGGDQAAQNRGAAGPAGFFGGGASGPPGAPSAAGMAAPGAGGGPNAAMMAQMMSAGGGGGGGAGISGSQAAAMMMGGGRGMGAPAGGGGMARPPAPRPGGQQTGVRPPSGTGHDFSVTLTLLQPIPPAPSYPAGGGGGAQGGAMGNPMGAMMMGGPMGGGMMAPGPPPGASAGMGGGGRSAGAMAEDK